MKIFFTLLLCLYVCCYINAQCFCGHIRITVKVPDLAFNRDASNYTVEMEEMEGNANRKGFFGGIFRRDRIKGDTLHFSFHTSGGVEKVTFRVTNRDTKKSMRITATDLHSDIEYSIDLAAFTPGHLLFTWNELSACLNAAGLTKELINCKGRTFYRVGRGERWDPHAIRPADPGSFLMKEE